MALDRLPDPKPVKWQDEPHKPEVYRGFRELAAAFGRAEPEKPNDHISNYEFEKYYGEAHARLQGALFNLRKLLADPRQLADDMREDVEEMVLDIEDIRAELKAIYQTWKSDKGL